MPLSNPGSTGGTANLFNWGDLVRIIANATTSAQNMLQTISGRGSNVSIADMFNMQILMNNLSQLSEMTTAIVSAANTSVQAMARNIKS